MSNTVSRLQAGDWVEGKGPAEIAQTLDSEGLLDGFPFMPEMMEFCRKRFRVLRRAEKTCVELPGVRVYKMREFLNNDVVLLELPRCSGASHDGCQRSCVLFWKEQWLRKTTDDGPGDFADQSGQADLRARLKTMRNDGRYLCQSTALADATQPMTRARVVLKCFYDVFSKSRGVLEMAKYILVPLLAYLRAKFPHPLPTGNLNRTPVEKLDLQPGEWVR